MNVYLKYNILKNTTEVLYLSESLFYGKKDVSLQHYFSKKVGIVYIGRFLKGDIFSIYLFLLFRGFLCRS